nr:molybdopterin-binding protein [Corynebacterium stationis]
MYPTTTPLKAAVIVVSDRISSGLKPDHAADSAVEMLQGADVEISHREIVREEEAAFTIALQSRLQAGDDIIVTLGGTGTRIGNVVPEVTGRQICARLLGLETQVLLKGLESSPQAGLSRGIIGVTKYGHPTTLIVNSAGSRGAVTDTLSVVLPRVDDILREC